MIGTYALTVLITLLIGMVHSFIIVPQPYYSHHSILATVSSPQPQSSTTRLYENDDDDEENIDRDMGRIGWGKTMLSETLLFTKPVQPSSEQQGDVTMVTSEVEKKYVFPSTAAAANNYKTSTLISKDETTTAESSYVESILYAIAEK